MTLEERRGRILDRYPKWENWTIWEWFEKTEESCPQEIFYIDDAVSYSYRQVGQMAREAAKAMRVLGVRPGEPVAILMGNRVEFAAFTFGAASLGAVKVPINRQCGPGEIRYILERTQARLLVTDRPDLVSQLGELPAKIMSWEELQEVGSGSEPEQAEADSGSEPRQAEVGSDSEPGLAKADSSSEPGLAGTGSVSAESLCDIIFTSGSTGNPKGVMLTHSGLLRAAFASCLNRGLEFGWRFYIPIPLYHVYGYVEGLLCAVIMGGSLVTLRDKFQPEAALRQMEAAGVNDILSVPFIMQKLLESPELDKTDLGRLKAIYCSASACPKNLWKEIREAFPHREVITGYGMTEVCGASLQTDPRDSWETTVDYVGKILWGGPAGVPEWDNHLISYRVVLADGREAAAREFGELICKGPVVTKGYYRDSKATESAFTREGWFKTGDIGYFDENGYLRLLGRCNDIYKINGENVSPQFLDRVIQRCPEVEAVETVGVPDPKVGWIGVAFIDNGQRGKESQERIREWCRKNLASFQVPHRFFFESSSGWPRTTNGKIQKYKLRQIARERLEEEDDRLPRDRGENRMSAYGFQQSACLSGQ